MAAEATMDEEKRQQREKENEKALEKIGPAEIRNQMMESVVPIDRIIDLVSPNYYFFTNTTQEIVTFTSHKEQESWRDIPGVLQTCRRLRSEGMSLYYGTNIFLAHLEVHNSRPDYNTECSIRKQPEEGLRVTRWMVIKYHKGCVHYLSCGTVLLVDFEAETVEHVKCGTYIGCDYVRFEWKPMRAGAENALRIAKAKHESARKQILTMLSLIARLKPVRKVDEADDEEDEEGDEDEVDDGEDKMDEKEEVKDEDEDEDEDGEEDDDSCDD